MKDYDPIEFAKRHEYNEGFKKGLGVGLFITVLFSGIIILLLSSCTSTKPLKAVPDYNHGRYERSSDNLKH